MAYLLAKDTVNGAEGKIFITRNGKNIEIAGMRNKIGRASCRERV